MARALSPPCCRSKCWRLRNSQLGATFEQKSPRLEYRYPNSLPFHEGLPESPTGIDPSGVHCGSGLDHAPLTGSLTSPSPAPVSRDSLPNKPHSQGSLSQDLLWGNPKEDNLHSSFLLCSNLQPPPPQEWTLPFILYK